MDDAPEGLSIELHFSERTAWLMVFRVRPPEGEPEDFERKLKDSKFDTGPDRYEWSSGTVGFVLALLNCKLGLQQKGNQRFYKFKGATANSPAASACAALDKQRWLYEGFGTASHTDREIAKEVFTVHKDPNGRTIAFGIDSRRLPPGNIQIFCGDPPKPIPEQSIRELYENIKEGWKPHHKRKRNRTASGNEAALAKPAPPYDEPATQSDITYETLHRSIEVLKARNLLIELASDAQARRWEHAATQYLAAERIFAAGGDLFGVAECRVMLCEIHFRLRTGDLKWLDNTTKLILRHGSAWQVVRFLLVLALYSPDAFNEEQTRLLLETLRENLRLFSKPISEGIGYKALLRETLLGALRGFGLPADVTGKTSSQMMHALRSGIHATLPQMERLSKEAAGRDPRLHYEMILEIGWFHLQSGQIEDALDYANRAKELGEAIVDDEKPSERGIERLFRMITRARPKVP